MSGLWTSRHFHQVENRLFPQAGFYQVGIVDPHLNSSSTFRETWGSNVTCLFFLLGHSPNKSVSERAQTEMVTHDDVVQTTVIDHYFHLTQKVRR